MSDQGNPSKRNPIFQGVDMGIGTWAWGDRLLWGYGRGYTDVDLKEAFDACLQAGLCFFDTAEIYGQGRSEELLGQFTGQTTEKITLATKFMPYPWRLSRRSLLTALRKSLKRLNKPRVDLYQIHMPLPPITIETWMEALAEAVQNNLIAATGVSNYDRRQTQRAYDALAHQGIHLASNQVEFSLLNRRAEKSGLLSQCRELGMTVIAYSPLAMGLLTGKYTPDNPPQGLRNRRLNRKYLKDIQPLVAQLRKIGAAHDGKTPAQVALNWVICKGALPIPGVKNLQQVQQNAGALNWRLAEAEMVELERLSDNIEKA